MHNTVKPQYAVLSTAARSAAPTAPHDDTTATLLEKNRAASWASDSQESPLSLMMPLKTPRHESSFLPQSSGTGLPEEQIIPAHCLLLSNAPRTLKYRSGFWKSSLPLQIFNSHSPAYAISPKILRVKQLCLMALTLPCPELQ